MEKVSVFWFRRDLRLKDNRGLHEALSGPYPVLPVFIFDDNILDELQANDPHVTFIYDRLSYLTRSMGQRSGNEETGLGRLYRRKGKPREVWMALLEQFSIEAAYANQDYEPYAIARDLEIEKMLAQKGVPFHLFKDQVIFDRDGCISRFRNRCRPGLPGFHLLFLPWNKLDLNVLPLKCGITI
jgi:deoxyribodipyrimidine photo-lyase